MSQFIFDKECAIFEKELDFDLKIGCKMAIIEGAEIYEDPEVMMEGVLGDIGVKFSATFRKAVNYIKELCTRAKKKLKKNATKVDAVKMAKAKKKLARHGISPEDMEKIKEYCKMPDKTKTSNVFNQYLKEMVALRRELGALGASHRTGTVASNGNSMGAGVEMAMAQNILKKIDEVEKKYDEAMVEASKGVVQLAVADSLRFSEKRIKNLEMNFDSLEKGHNKILFECEKDIKTGKLEPVKVNALRKISMSITSTFRKQIAYELETENRVIFNTAGLIAAVTASAAAIGVLSTQYKNM